MGHTFETCPLDCGATDVTLWTIGATADAGQLFGYECPTCRFFVIYEEDRDWALTHSHLIAFDALRAWIWGEAPAAPPRNVAEWPWVSRPTLYRFMRPMPTNSSTASVGAR